MEKEKLAKPGSMTLTNPLERIAMKRGMVGTTEAMNPSFISRRQGSDHGSSVSETSSKKLNHMKETVKGRVPVSMDALVQQTKSPFTTGVLHFPLPAKFRIPQIETFD